MDQKRHFTRIKSDFEVKIEFNNNVYKGKLVDISWKGILVYSQEIDFLINSFCVISIPLLPNESVMKFTCKLVHVIYNHFGFEFQWQDLDLMIYLRKFLELNSDSEQITKELLELFQK